MFLKKIIEPTKQTLMRRTPKFKFGKLKRQREFIQSRLLHEAKKREQENKQKAFPVLQYPENLGDRNTIIFDPNENQEYLTPKNHVEVTFYDDSTQAGTTQKILKEGLDERIKQTKIGYGLGLDNKSYTQKGQCIAFVGLPNSGKSSILNRISDQELSAVSNKSHTTAENMLYIKNYITAEEKDSSKIRRKVETNTNEQDNIQLLFYDSPGLLGFDSSDKMKSNEGWKASEQSDTIVLVVDCLRRINSDLIQIVRNLAKFPERGPCLEWDLENTKEREIILVLNKVDLCNNKRKLYGIKTELEDYLHFNRIFITSAETGFGTEELLDYLKDGAVKRQHYFGKFQIGEVTEIEILEESCRQAIYNNFYEELPHKFEVEVTELSFQATGKAKLEVKIFGYKNIHKPLIIGKGGRNIKQMRREIGKSFMQRYGLPVDVLIQIGTRRMASIQNSQVLNFKGNRKLVNENARQLRDMHRKVEAAAYRDAQSGVTHKEKMEQELRNEMLKMGMNDFKF